MTRRTGWILAAVSGFIGLLGGALLFAPARLWGVALEAATAGHVQLVNAQGTLWRGRGDLWVHGDAGSLALPGGIGWRLDSSPGQWLSVDTLLELPCCALSPWQWRLGRLADGWGAEARPFESTWNIAWLRGLGSPWNTLDFHGTMQVTISDVKVLTTGSADAPRLQGEWRADLMRLASAVSTVRPLGSYRLSGTLDGPDGPTLQLRTLEGDLRLQGDGHWSRGHFRFRGVAEANAERLDALGNLLNLLGRRDGPRAHLRLG